MIDHYAARRGEARPAAKMTPERVNCMRVNYATKLPRPTMRQLAKLYGISCSCVHAIIARRTWKHVP